MQRPSPPNRPGHGTIVLAKPALARGALAEDNWAYQGWLYAAVENPNGTFNGLYVTKDDGANWTLVQLGNIPGTDLGHRPPFRPTPPTQYRHLRPDRLERRIQPRKGPIT